MGIIHIAGASVWGGGEQYVYDINAEMRRRGKDVYVLVDESNTVLCSRFAETAEVVPVKLYKGRGIASLFSTARFYEKAGNRSYCLSFGKIYPYGTAFEEADGC